MQRTKDPRLVEAGYRGAVRRWGTTPVKVYIGDLPGPVREDILARIEAERRAAEREQRVDAAKSAQEMTAASSETSAAVGSGQASDDHLD